MPAVEVLDGAVVRVWLRLAADALDRARPAIDVLNVFPVADSDTGTNLHRTIATASDALAELPEPASTADIWRAAATAALRGACGNSGIIVSQLLCGLADTCAPATPCDGRVVALALGRAAALARAAVHRPVEGTVLTVADAAAEAAAQAAAQSSALSEIGRAAAAGARQALMATRQQLDVLAASGVVDAGGAGLCVLLDALNAAISGSQPGAFAVPEPAAAHDAGAATAAAPPEFRYEVTFLLDAAQKTVAALRDRLDALGDSLVVSGRDPQWHVHVHVADAGAVIEAALAAGQPSKITITYLNETQANMPTGQPLPPSRVVAVADGPGLVGLLRGAGATAIDLQPAGDPGTALDELAPSREPAVLIAPAGRVTGRWPTGWPVLEVECLVQSLAAVAVHDPRRDQDADLDAMRRAVAGMRWASLSLDKDAMAARRSGAGLLVGRVAGQVAACNADQVAIAIALTEQLLAADTEMITLVTGLAADPELGAAVAGHIAAHAPAVEVVCYDGGMTSAVLLIGAE
jgi:DAK2 domain fusion protein YloV